MKTQDSVQKSADAALRSALEQAFSIHQHLMLVLNERKAPGEMMPAIRAELAVLTQRIHEFNAYSNVLLTE